MAAKAISTSSFDWKHAVFLSLGERTQATILPAISTMHWTKKESTPLSMIRILEKVKRYHPMLITAIRRSRCSIIVLSENYASSKWCLEELVEILVCNRTKNRRVVPIFYNVDPSHVRNQTGSFGEAMAKHEKNLKIKKEKVQKWREALTQVAYLSGFHSMKSNL